MTRIYEGRASFRSRRRIDVSSEKNELPQGINACIVPVSLLLVSLVSSPLAVLIFPSDLSKRNKESIHQVRIVAAL